MIGILSSIAETVAVLEMMETGCKVILKKRHFFGGKKRLTGHSVELAGTSMG